MGGIIVYQSTGELDLNRPQPLCFVTKAELNQQLLSVDRISISVQSTVPIIFNIGDYIIYEGRKYTLNLNPADKKTSDNDCVYDLQFEGVQYELIRKVLFNQDAGGFFNTSDFPLTGELDEFLNLIIANANRDSEYTWSLGIFPDNTEAKTITFNGTNCLAALQSICQEENFGVEFDLVENITAKTIQLNIRNVGSVLPFTFEYGFRRGLYTIERTNVDESNIITRLYAYGSSENIPSNYRDYSSRLRMPVDFGDYIEDPVKKAKYGRNEGVINYDDIKPTFTGIISAVGSLSDGLQEITVSNMDFDLNEKKTNGDTKYLIPDTPAKISVKKGNLAGYEFEINAYDHATKIFKIKQFVDTRGMKFPDLSTVFKFAVGDQFTLLDIVMPDIRITEAENKLKAKAIEEYAKQSQARVKYNIDIDPMYFFDLGYVENAKILGIGDFVTVVDAKMDINAQSRIVSLTRDILNPFKYTCDLSDTYEVGIVTSVVQTIQSIKTEIKAQTKVNSELMLSGYRRFMEMQGMVFDNDGYFDPTNIKPNSIETNMLSVGSRSQQLTLKDTIFTPNANNNPNAINISAGQLIHFSIDPAGIKTWNLAGYNSTSLNSANSYYIYARVSKAGTTGTYVVATDQRKFDQEANFYNFLLGVLFMPSTVNGASVRLIQLTYGSTWINGRTITTGRIVSVDGLTWFDLDSGEFHGKFTFTDGTNVQTAVAGAQSTADSASTAAANAQTAADNANTAITNLNTYVDGAFSDGIISEAEAIAIEKYINAVNTEYNAFDNQYNILYNNSYLAGTPKTNLASAKTAYNTAKNNLLLSINTAIADGKTTTGEKSEVDSKYSSYKTALGALQQRIEEANTSIQSYLNNAAATAKTTANSAISQLTDIASDSKLTPSEKQTTQNEWNRVKTEYNQNYSVATNLGVSTTAYTSAYNTLNSYITPLLANLTTTSDIVGSTFRTNFNNYYTQNVALVQAIENKKIDNVQIGGSNFLRNSKNFANLTNWTKNANVVVANAADYITLVFPASTASSGIYQRIDLGGYAGDITISFDAMGTYAGWNADLIIGIEGKAVKSGFGINDVTTWTRFSFTLNLATATNACTFIFYKGNNANPLGIRLRNIKLEKGNKATDWTPAPEDVDAATAAAATAAANALAQAQNAQNTASGAAAITNGLFTQINGNIVATGTMLAGDATNINSGITGVTDEGDNSVRFWAGASYANRKTAPWLVKQNGVEEWWFNGVKIREQGIIGGNYVDVFYNTDGTMAKRTAVINNYITEEWYNSGELVYQIGRNGIYYVKEIAQSWTPVDMRQINTSIGESPTTTQQTTLKNTIIGASYTSAGYYFISKTATYYNYNAGQNVYSDSNKQYEGFKNTSGSKTDNITNGWYVKSGQLQDYWEGNSSTKVIVEAIYVSGGKITSSITFYINKSEITI